MTVSSLEGNHYNMGMKPTILRECHGFNQCTGEVVELIRHVRDADSGERDITEIT